MMVIYKITNLLNGKIYVGKNSNNRKSYYGSGKYIKRAIKKHGKQNFNKEILQECSSLDELNSSEIFWINKFDCKYPNGYNFSDGGAAGFSGCKHSEMSKLQIKESTQKFFDENPLVKQMISEKGKGRIFSDERNQKISNSKKDNKNWVGKHCSEEHKQKIRDSHMGIKFTEERKENISKSKMGKKLSDETKRKISIKSKLMWEKRRKNS